MKKTLLLIAVASLIFTSNNNVSNSSVKTQRKNAVETSASTLPILKYFNVDLAEFLLHKDETDYDFRLNSIPDLYENDESSNSSYFMFGDQADLYLEIRLPYISSEMLFEDYISIPSNTLEISLRGDALKEELCDISISYFTPNLERFDMKVYEHSTEDEDLIDGSPLLEFSQNKSYKDRFGEYYYNFTNDTGYINTINTYLCDFEIHNNSVEHDFQRILITIKSISYDYELGKNDGMNADYNVGFNDGKNVGFDQGKEIGFEQGKNIGFDQGKEIGFNQAKEKYYDWWNKFIDFFVNLWNEIMKPFEGGSDEK